MNNQVNSYIGWLWFKNYYSHSTGYFIWQELYTSLIPRWYLKSSIKFIFLFLFFYSSLYTISWLSEHLWTPIWIKKSNKIICYCFLFFLHSIYTSFGGRWSKGLDLGLLFNFKKSNNEKIEIMTIKILLSLYTVAFILLFIMTVSFFISIDLLHLSYWVFLILSIPYFITLLVDLYKSKRQTSEKVLLTIILFCFLPYHIYYIWYEYGVRDKWDSLDWI